MKNLIGFIVILTISFTQETIAIIDFDALNVSDNDSKALTQRLTSEMNKIGKYTVVERSEMKRLLDEQKFQYSGCVDISCAVEIGKMLGAKSMVVGTISKVGDVYSIDARLIDVRTAESYTSASYTTDKDISVLIIEGMKSISEQLSEDPQKIDDEVNVSIYPVHDKINSFLTQADVDTFTVVNDTTSVVHFQDTNIQKIKSPARALFLSGILPGAGELYMGNTLRGALFMGIEAAAVGTWYAYNQKGSDQQDAYKAYADEHWNLSRWIHDYYKWNDDDILDVDGNNARSIFVGSSVFGEDTTYNYPDIWEDSHHVTYTWTGDPRMVDTNNDEFRTIYRDMCGYTSTCNSSTQEEIEASLTEKNYNLEKNHHFYENIGKYDHFYAGWDDNDSLYMVIKEEGGEKLAMSPNKAEYRNMWTSANEDFFQIATYALSVIMANHVISMVDALLLAKLSQYTDDVEVSAQPYFNSETPYGISGVNLSIAW